MGTKVLFAAGVSVLAIAAFILCRLPSAAAAASGEAATTPVSQPATSASTVSATPESLWKDMGSDIPLTAYKAAWALAEKKDKALAFLEPRLATKAPADPERMAQLIKDLDDDRFKTRQAASDELAAMGLLAQAALKAALEKKPSPEVRARVEQLLKMAAGPAAAEARRARWAVRTLEAIGSPKAQEQLARLAEGSPQAATLAAEALARLKVATSRPASMPADNVLLLVRWVVAVRPSIAGKVLQGGTPVAAKSKEFVALRCHGEAVRAAVGAGVGTPEVICVETWCRWSAPASGPSADSIMINEQWNVGNDWWNAMMVGGAFPKFSVSKGAASLSLDVRDVTCRINNNGNAASIQDSLVAESGLRPGEAVCVVARPGRLGDCDPYFLMVWQTVSIPGELAPYFQGSNNAKTWVAGGSEALTRRAREGIEWNRMARALKHETDERWTHTLPNGGQIQLLNVREPAKHPFYCWDGDGWPVAGGPNAIESSAKGFYVMFRVRDGGEGGWATTGAAPVDPNGTVEVGIDAGPWKQEAAVKVGETVTAAGVDVKFTEASPAIRKRFMQKGLTWVRAELEPNADMEIAVGAVDKAGSLVVPQSQMQVKTSRPKATGHKSPTIHAVGIDAGDVDHYVVLSRPRCWTTFTDFAKAPRQGTTLPATEPAGK